jgi:5-methyltetrahydropteroyltriglutamate--homocysteine methyltransferase
MKRSTERILTTHTGSLPRPDDLVRMMYDKSDGKPVDEAAVQERIRTAVIEVVEKQRECGVDIVNDGEASKISYSTYVTERLTGFGGEAGPRAPGREFDDFPEYMQRVFSDPRRFHLKTPACHAPVTVRDTDAVQRDTRNLKAALQGVQVEEAFVTAASPGVISIFLPNAYYATEEEYLAALADAMRPEYEAIVEAGFILQLDCPDLTARNSAANAYLTMEQFRAWIEMHVEILNYALANISPDRLRLHLCWGNYEGPHHLDVPLRDIVDIVLRARPSGLSLEACNPRHEHEWAVFKDVKLPEGKVLIPGVIDSTTNFIEHPELIAQRIVRYAEVVGRDNVIAGSDCGFGTVVGLSAVDPRITWAKLEAMAEGARLASQELWNRTAVGASRSSRRG